MKKLSFETHINASAEAVWEALWGEETYPEWTSAFSPGSHAKTDWQKGSKVLFLDGKGSGMVARIEDVKPNELMFIQHLGIVKDGVEDTESEAVKGWAGAHENYYLQPSGEGTTLRVEMDSTEEYEQYFKDTWPKAFEKLKRVAEGVDTAH